MAGKRHINPMDHVMHNKLSRLELSQRSTPCFGIATSQDLQTHQNFKSYPMPDSEGQDPASPWSSTTAYLQYASSALNERLQTREASLKFQRPPAERQHNPLHLSDNSNSQVSVHQNNPVHNYHISCPRACPPIAMPRPVYRSSSNFMDAAYGSRGFQSLGICVASQPLGPPAVEWSSSTRFAHSSPLYATGAKKQLSNPGIYPEVTGSPTSRSQLLQESPVYRRRADMSLAVGVSSTCSKNDIFTDSCHSVAQQNIQLLYAEGNVPLGRQRTSAFTAPSPQRNSNKPGVGQVSLDHQMGHLYSKNIYSNATNGMHQTSSPYSCSMDLAGSPHIVREGTVYTNRPQNLNSGYMNAELRVQMSRLDGTVQPSERPYQVIPGIHRTITEFPVCSPQRDKNLWVQSGQINRDICESSSRTDKEILFDTTSSNRSLQESTPYQDLFTIQRTHAAFAQQSSSSVKAPVVSNHELLSGQKNSSHSVTLEASSLHSSIHSFEDSVTGIRTVENTTTSHSSRSHINIENAPSTVPSPHCVSGVDGKHSMNNNVLSRHDAAAVVSPNCELPGSNLVDADGAKSASTSVSENVNIDNPKSPPMPVINDVFSLAPYRAYLEGKAPHPFSINQESETESIASTSAFLETPLSENKSKKAEGLCSVSKVVNSENENVKIQNGECVQHGEKEISMQNTSEESVVLDLSLKKLPQMSSSTCGQQDFSSYEKSALHTVAAENYPSKARKQNQGKEDYLSSDTSNISHLGHESFSTQTFSTMVESRSINRLASSGQENRQSTENVHYQRSNPIVSQSPKDLPCQENCQHQPTERQKSNLEKNCRSLAIKSLSSRHQECDHLQDTERLLQKSSPSRKIEHFPQSFQMNRPSTEYKSKSRNFQDLYKSHSKNILSHQPQDNYSQVSEHLPQQELTNSTIQTLRTLPVCSSVQYPSHPDLSVFVNTIKTQTTVLPVILASPPAVYFTNTIALHTSQSPSIEKPGKIAKHSLESCHSLSSPSGSENESNGFHSSKSFMFRKYKMNKFSSSDEETRRVSTDSASQNMSNLFSSDTVQSLPPSAPESSPALGEANVSLASVGEPSLSSSGKQFCDLHRSVHTAITSSVGRSSSSLLEDWLSKTKEEETSQTPVKTKNSFRFSDQSSDLPGHDIWLAFDGVRLLLYKLLSQLETFMFTRGCPFPHVIRAGASFIPIYQVKEVLFPELVGPTIDKVLQKHKVELRPTTLSEERFLRETELKDCPSRMLKLMALKQLPDVYPDLLRLFCRHTIEQELCKRTQSLGKEKIKLNASPKKEPHSASPRKVKSSLILKLQRVRKHSGIHVYKTQNLKTTQKDKLQKTPVCRKKPYKARPVFSYKKRRQRRRTARFPNLVGKRILHLFDDGDQEVWFRGRVLRVHRRSRNPRDTQYEVWYDEEPGTRYFLELLQDYEKGWLRLDGSADPCKTVVFTQ